MTGLQWVIEIVLIGLLAATLVHALRLERALGVVKRDRAELEGLVQDFDEGVRQADGAGRAIARQIEGATNLKDDLSELVERGEKLAARLELGGLPSRRLPEPEPELAEAGAPRVRSQAERDLLRALRVTR
jgi:Domain of unknown function (DUF6468)